MILKTIRDIFDTTRLIIQARRNGFKGGFILMSEQDNPSDDKAVKK